MSWRKGQAYGQDLRDRVLQAPGRLREVALRFGVSASYVLRVRARREQLGQSVAGAQCNHMPLRLGALKMKCWPKSRQLRTRRSSSCASGRAPAMASWSSRPRCTRAWSGLD